MGIDEVGNEVGTKVGRFDGVAVGVKVGSLVGMIEGTKEGRIEGLMVGNIEGLKEAIPKKLTVSDPAPLTPPWVSVMMDPVQEGPAAPLGRAPEAYPPVRVQL